MVAAAFRKQLTALLSLAMSEGHLAKGFVWTASTKVAVNELRKIGGGYIDMLFELLEKAQVKFDRVKETMKLLNQSAKKVGAQRLGSLCQEFIDV